MGRRMRAVGFASFGEPDVLQVVDVEVPEPGPGEIRIAVRGCGVNPYDAKQRRGLFGGEPPIRTGIEVAGVVDAIGPGTETTLAIGNPVYGAAPGGGAAELALSSAFAPAPESIDLVAAAAVPVAAETTYRVLDLMGVTRGTTLLVNGASGAVGQAMVQVAIARGAAVIGTSSAPSHPLLERLGARPVAYGDSLVADVRALGVRSVDVSIDAGGSSLPALVELAGGDVRRVVTIAPDEQAAALGVQVSGGMSAFHAYADIAALIADGRYAPPVTETYSFDQAAEAHRRIEAGGLGGRKLVLVP